MKIGVIGAGNIGGTLGKKWAQAGHEVVFGVRDRSDSRHQALLVANARVESVADAIAVAEVVLLSVPGKTVADLIETHATALNHKIIIDATNRMSEPVMNGLAFLAQHAPDAHLYRAFNSLGWENFEQPIVEGVQADLLYCGVSGDSLALVDSLIADIGLRPIYVGGLDRAPLVDMLGALWGALAYGQNKGRHLAFRVLSES